MFEGIIFLLLTIGISALLDLIIRVVSLLIDWLIDKIRNFIKEKVGNKVFLCEIGDVITELKNEAQRNGNVAEINQIIAQLDGEGIVEGDISDDTINVQIIKANNVDPKITATLRKNNGQVILS